MNASGGNKKQIKTPIDYKFPPKRTAKEWRDLTKQKLRQYENINYEIMGKPSKIGGAY